MMRRILVNYATARAAQKRGDGKTVLSLDDVNSFPQADAVDVLFLDDALKQLAEFDSQQAKIVELKFFAGLTNEETAKVLAISDSTVKREWRMAKAWLTTRLT
jgi:RNA polymerase sigma factor (TIGR02999 family)